MKKKIVAVGLSGGVDSSVAAHLLKESGYEVIGLFMKNWDEDDDQCPSAQDYEDALLVAEHLKIPLHSFNFSKEYWENVFKRFLHEIESGRTPNPDIWCNKEIKFKVFLDKAKELGADYLATGHYAKISAEGLLERGIDEMKDQSYFLYTLTEDLLKQLLFPIGNLEKAEVRKIAHLINLPTASKKDSTGICFIGKRNFREFISQYITSKPGTFCTPDGEVVGQHEGAYYYTIGQRKGMGIGGPGEAWFVAEKDIKSQVVTVVQGEDHPLLMSQGVIANELTWVSGEPDFPVKCTAKIRYRQHDHPCVIKLIEPGKVIISFDSPQKAATEGQSIVFYQGTICLGGGIIQTRLQKTSPN